MKDLRELHSEAVTHFNDQKLEIREFQHADWKGEMGVWAIVKHTARQGTTYAYSRDMTEEEAYYEWIKKPSKTYVVVNRNPQGCRQVLGTFYIKENNPKAGGGEHVCNCGYMVSLKGRKRGIGLNMGKYSLLEAKKTWIPIHAI